MRIFKQLIDCDMPRDDALVYASIVLQQCMHEGINALTEAHVGRPLSEYPEKKDALFLLEKSKHIVMLAALPVLMLCQV